MQLRCAPSASTPEASRCTPQSPRLLENYRPGVPEQRLDHLAEPWLSAGRRVPKVGQEVAGARGAVRSGGFRRRRQRGNNVSMLRQGRHLREKG